MKNEEKIIRIGLGEAVSRLMRLELTRANGLHPVPSEAIAEREMLFLALNEIKIDLGFDCNNDGIPDSVEIFKESVKSSCCRLIQTKDEKEKATKIIPAEKQFGRVTKIEESKEEIKNRRKRKNKSRRK
jgi:hypothetical protein